jgi:hypothetical protein
MQEIISRKNAKKLGLKKYFTGKPCKNGHTSERYTITGICTECQKEKNKNADKSKIIRKNHDQTYYEKNKQRISERNKEKYKLKK